MSFWSSGEPEHKALKRGKTTAEYELGNDRTGYISSTASSPLHYCSKSPLPSSYWKTIQQPFFSMGHLLNKAETLYSTGPGLHSKQNLMCEELLKDRGCHAVTVITSPVQKPHNLSSPQATWLKQVVWNSR